MLADWESAERAQELVEDLPARGGCQFLVAVPRWDDYIGFGRRGLFASD
jgi:hypothetical protein